MDFQVEVMLQGPQGEPHSRVSLAREWSTTEPLGCQGILLPAWLWSSLPGQEETHLGEIFSIIA